HGVRHAERAQRVGQLQRAGAAAHDDRVVGARREWLVGQLSHLVVFRTLRASPCSRRYITFGCFSRKDSKVAVGRIRQRSARWATMSATGGSPSSAEISPKKSPGRSVERSTPSTRMLAVPSRIT